MKKIYNNLTIENLIKTEEFNSFNKEKKEEIITKADCFNIHQKYEILNGIRKNVAVSIYANPDFNSFQMAQIRYGLEKNLDVSIYAKPIFLDTQMLEIRIGLEQNLDVSIYAKTELSAKQMDQIRMKLLKESTL